jgi:hypothetical protein
MNSRPKLKILCRWLLLNGELFKRINGIDDLGLYLPDDVIGDFIEFLFQYNFTVEENSRYDENWN